MKRLSHEEVLKIHACAISCWLHEHRGALLAGIDARIAAGIPMASAPNAQILCDLTFLNDTEAEVGSTWLETWVKNALTLVGARNEAEPLRAVLSVRGAAPISVNATPQSRRDAADADGISDESGPTVPGALIGRRHVFAALDRFLETASGGYFVVRGAPGTGKTTFMREYARRSGTAVHFSSRFGGKTRAEELVDGVCEQLRRRFGTVASVKGRDLQPEVRLQSALERAVRLLGRGERLIVGVDAVDDLQLEAVPGSRAAVVFPEELPERVFFILTQRSNAPPPATSGPIHILDLDAFVDENINDIQCYVKAALRRPGVEGWFASRQVVAEDVVPDFVEAGAGTFLYFRHVLEDIESGRYDQRQYAELPKDLDAYYRDRWLRGTSTLAEYGREQAAVLYLLAMENQPLPVEDLVRLGGGAEHAVTKVIDEWRGVLSCKEEAAARPRYAIEHDGFREFLFWQNEVQAVGVELSGAQSTVDDTLGMLFGRDLARSIR